MKPLCMLALFLLSCLLCAGARASVLAQTPLFVSNIAPPMNMLVVGRDQKLYFPAYNDASDIDGDGHLDILSGSYSRMDKDMAGLFQVLYGKADKTFRKAEVLKGTDGKLNAVSAAPAPAAAIEIKASEAWGKACAIDDPDCEACQ